MGERKVDLICAECPLETCDEGSLWCAFRFATDPNPVQMDAMRGHIRRQLAVVTIMQAELRREARRQYLADHYKANRTKKLAAANARNAAIREARREAR